MNKHFEDTRYYLKRASEHAKEGIVEELEPVEEKARELTGREKEPEPGRVEKLRAKLSEAKRRVEREVQATSAAAEAKLRSMRGRTS